MNDKSRPDPTVLMSLFNEAPAQPAGSVPPLDQAKSLERLSQEAWGSQRSPAGPVEPPIVVSIAAAKNKPTARGRPGRTLPPSTGMASDRMARLKGNDEETVKVTSVRLYPSLIEPLRRLSFETRATQTELFNEALADLFAKYQALGLDLRFGAGDQNG